MTVIALEPGMNWGAPRGMDGYCWGLIEALAMVDEESDYRVFTFFFREFAAKAASLPVPDAPNFARDPRRWPESLVRGLEWRLGLPVIERLYVRPAGIGLYHGLCGRLPRLSIPTVVTVHDLAFETRRAQELAQGRRPALEAFPWVEDAARRATRVIATTEAAKRDLATHYGIDLAKVRVVHYGVDSAFFSPEAGDKGLEVLRAGRGLKEPYLLFMGPFDWEWRRHLLACLEAVALLRKEGLAREKLVFAGALTGYCRQIADRADLLGLGQDLVWTGYLPREELPALYRGARLFVHPVTHAFGLAALEAMACGAPVVSSTDAGSGIPEILGDGALLAEATDPADIARAMREALGSEAARAALAERGLKRAREMSWRRAARATLEVYGQALAA